MTHKNPSPPGPSLPKSRYSKDNISAIIVAFSGAFERNLREGEGVAGRRKKRDEQEMGKDDDFNENK